MIEASVIGHLASDDDKKRKDEEARPLVLPFTTPSYHLLVGGADSRHEELLGAIITNALLARTSIVAFDTAGMIVPFLLPFLPGEHVKKLRGFKERVPQALVENMRPAGVFFNSPVEEMTGYAFKGWFSLPKILLDAARLTIPQQNALQDTFGISKRVLMKDVLQGLVAVATGKDYAKVMARAAAFVEYLVTGFELLADRGIPFPTWVHARDALFNGDLSIPKPAGLSDGDIDLFAQTIDFYISNAMLFKPPRPGPASIGPECLARVNFLVFYLQDMNEREQALAIALAMAQHAIATVVKPDLPDDPISTITRQGNTCLAFDELGIIARKGQPAMQPLATTISLPRLAAARGLAFLAATRKPSTVDLELLDTDVIGPSIAAGVETNVYIGKVKEKEGLAGIASWIDGKGVKISPALLDGLKPLQTVLVRLRPPAGALRFDMLESGAMSIAVTPGLLKSMLATPILVSKKAGSPAAVVTPAMATVPQRAPGSMVFHEPVTMESTMPSPGIGIEAPRTRDEPTVTAAAEGAPSSPAEDEPGSPAPPAPGPGPGPALVVAIPVQARLATNENTPVATSPRSRPVTDDGQLGAPPPATISPAVPCKPITRATPAREQPVEPIVEDLLDQYEPGEDDVTADAVVAGNNGDEQGNEGSGVDFLSRLLGTDRGQASAGGKISRFDYNMALNALLFKLEQVVKAPFGVQFFKELKSARSIPSGRAMEMYFQESNAMLRGKFAVQRGDVIVYQGIVEAMRAIIAELGLHIPLPPAADLEQLEAALVSALDLPRGELLQRIKDGSLYF